MQSVQSAVLKQSIKPGQSPVFIIAPQIADGLPLATLLSRQLQPGAKYCKLQGVVNADNNYFFNDPVRPLLTSPIPDHKIKEAVLKTTVALQEGMDNGKLWGLLCTYEFFSRIRPDELFPDAFFLFLLHQSMPPADAATLIRFNEALAHRCVAINQETVPALADIILRELPLAPEVKIRPGKPNLLIEETGAEENGSKHDGRLAVERLKELDFIVRKDAWYRGDELLFFLTVNSRPTAAALDFALRQISAGFPYAPRIILLDRGNRLSGIEPATLERILADNHADWDTQPAPPWEQYNKYLRSANPQLVVTADLDSSFPLVPMLLPFRSGDPAFTCAAASEKSEQENIRLADVLTTHVITAPIVFPYALWKRSSGFDTSFTDDHAVWDFAIRLLEMTGGYAVSVPGGTLRKDLAASAESLRQPDPVAHPHNYRQIIEKHYELFQSSLDEVIRLISSKQHLPQHEIRSLQQRVQTLQSLLSHSKKELKALNELSASLQQRIHDLEQRWYFRAGKKLSKYLKIFVKKKSPGKGTLKRILEFLMFAMSKAGFRIVRKVIKGGLKKLYLLAENRPVRIVYLDEGDGNHVFTYHDWIMAKLDPSRLRQEFELVSPGLSYQPKISIVMPVYEPPLNFLKQAIESVIRQQYENWELCLADDCSPNPQVQKMLQVYAAKDPRIKIELRTENGHISAASNSALALATGQYILFMDHDDALTENCLFEVVRHLNEHPGQEIIYSDEDKINEKGQHSMPHFKPDWAPHNLLSRNYFGHVVVIKKSIVDEIEGFRLGFEGSQDYDLLLRATEKTDRIGHIPKVLYHWRIHSKSAAQSEDVKPYAYIAARKALEETLQRRGTPGEVAYLSGLRGYRIRYAITAPGKVSIIIPTKDQVKLLKNTIDSIFRLTDYRNFEIIVLNNNSTSPEFFTLMDQYRQQHDAQFRCIEASFPFNFAKLMNLGVAESTGDYILFLNNDMEVIHEDWLATMVSHAQHRHTGIVGAKLLYPDDHIQHAGVIVGLGGVAGHAFVHAHKDDPGYFNYIQSMNNFSALTAACVLFRKEIYAEVGGMTELFEVEYNDVDFCLKVMQAGYYNVYLPDVELYHFESSTRGHPHQNKESWNRHLREIALFKERWQHIIDHDPYYNPNLNLGTHDFSMNFSA